MRTMVRPMTEYSSISVFHHRQNLHVDELWLSARKLREVRHLDVNRMRRASRTTRAHLGHIPHLHRRLELGVGEDDRVSAVHEDFHARELHFPGVQPVIEGYSDEVWARGVPMDTYTLNRQIAYTGVRTRIQSVAKLRGGKHSRLAVMMVTAA